MAPVAQRLSAAGCVLEPLLTAMTVDGQVEECVAALEEYAGGPVVLIGHSWGAWLSLIVAARSPSSVRKVICVGSGAFEEEGTDDLMRVRLERLSPEEQAETKRLLAAISDPATDDDAVLARFGALMAKADTFHPLPPDEGGRDAVPVRVNGEVHRRVWAEAREMRRNGRLLEICGQVHCPVVAVHGDYDPHPAAGVAGPLSRVIDEFRFILLENCGHCPWLEREARDRFYEILIREVR
ncbi:alpha/beta hydrolase [Methanofollis fontis]|uniref:Alpha/beta hydrolase n=2 Tax=Methanofollis fontis TaxID=2052832 RepID=A0A483CL39_9EURY|nr:alpha/beta hydrolase [Methanofollis fontis]